MSLVWLAYGGLLLAAAGSDLARYRIPNFVVLALAGLFAVPALMHAEWGAVAAHLSVGTILLAVGFGCFGAGIMGAGDAKLLAAAGLWAGVEGMSAFLLTTAASGLLLAGIILVLRFSQKRRRVANRGDAGAHEGVRILREGEGVPYGVALAAGALAASFWSPAWLWPL